MRRFVLVAAAASFCLATPVLARTLKFEQASLPKSGVLVIAAAEQEKLDGVAQQIDTAAGGALGKAIAAAGFKGKPGETLHLYGFAGYQRLTLIGIGNKGLDRTALENFGGTVARAIKDDKTETIFVAAPTSDATGLAQIALGADLSFYTYDAYREKKKPSTGTLAILASNAAAATNAWENSWRPVATGVRFTRNLVSEPSNIKTPEWMVSKAREAFANVPNITIEVLDVPAMQKLGMGLILGVGQGSVRPPRMMIVRYTGNGNAAPIVLTGKGITFDSGGISIKPAEAMWRMRYDMAGAAASLGTVLTLAKRNAKTNAIAIAALAENLPSGSAIRPGDVLTAMNGKTAEIINTDAEGRLVLGDASWYGSTKFAPAAQISIATLTGSARAALGADFAALLTKDDGLKSELEAAGKAAGEPVWPLPLTDTHTDAIKSDVADVKNAVEGGFAGASTGAEFIRTFVKPGTRWAHLDIAGVAWADKDLPTVPKGAAGWGVRILDTYFRSLENK